MLDVGIKETTTTTGTGTVTLSAITGFARVSSEFQSPDAVMYVLESGNGDKEWGIGTPGAGNTFARTYVAKTDVSGTRTEVGAMAISLTGTSTLTVTPHVAAPAIALNRVNVQGASAVISPMLSVGSANSTIALGANRAYAMAFAAPSSAHMLTGLGLVVTTLAAGTAYIGVAESAVNSSGAFKPGRLLGQGSVSTSTTGVKTDTSSYLPRLKPGHVYWLVLISSAAATIRAIGSANILNMLGLSPSDGITPYTWLFNDSLTGPLPSDLSSTSFGWPSPGLSAPHIFFTT